MKRMQLIANIVLVVAVGVLYLLFFMKKPLADKPVSKAGDSVTYSSDFSKAIYYINFDTVQAYYHMFIDLQDQLERKAKTSEAELTSRGQQLQRDFGDYQEKMQKGLLLRSEAQEIEQQLAAGEQQLMRLQENKRLELAQEQVVANRKVLVAVMDYLEKLQPKYNYHFVMGTSFGGGVLYANTDLDITREVINGLNEEYKKERAKKK